MLFVEEMPGERCSLFERAVADSPVLSFSFLAVPNLILFCVFFLGTGDDGFMMMMMMTMMLLLFLLSFLTSTPFLSLFLTLGKLSTTELHPNSILKKPRPVYLPICLELSSLKRGYWWVLC